MITEQLNFRVSTGILRDLEFIANVHRIPKTEWLKVQLARMVREEKNKCLDIVEHDYIHSVIGDREFKELTGIAVPPGLKAMRDQRENSIKGIRKTIFRQMPKDQQEALRAYWELDK